MAIMYLRWLDVLYTQTGIVEKDGGGSEGVEPKTWLESNE